MINLITCNSVFFAALSSHVYSCQSQIKMMWRIAIILCLLEQVTCLTLLHLSPASDTNDHTILEHLSSWFSITSNALSWVKFYHITLVLYRAIDTACYHLCINFSTVCLKVLYLVLFYSSCTLFLSALSFLIHLQIIILYADMTLNFSYFSSCFMIS